MVAALGFIFGPKTGPIFWGAVSLIVGFVAAGLGDIPVAFVAIGVAVLVFTAAEIQFWRFTVPAGIVLIVIGILWATVVSPYLPVVP